MSRPWPFVRTLIDLDEVDSTSDRAAQMLQREEVLLPLCVWARRQSSGRGRGDHAWWSDPGSLTFTLAIDPDKHGLARESDPLLSLATAVAVIDAIEALGFGHPSLGIRWPNDIQVGALKLGGILPERVESPGGRRLLIGIGLNVTTDLEAMPADVRGRAISLSAIRGGRMDAAILSEVLAAILDRVGSVLPRLADRDPGLLRRWEELDLLRGEWAIVDLGTRTVAGRCRGIAEDGALCIGDGPDREFLLGGQVLR